MRVRHVVDDGEPSRFLHGISVPRGCDSEADRSI
jgi:hypothetical protein